MGGSKQSLAEATWYERFTEKKERDGDVRGNRSQKPACCGVPCAPVPSLKNCMIQIDQTTRMQSQCSTVIDFKERGPRPRLCEAAALHTSSNQWRTCMHPTISIQDWLGHGTNGTNDGGWLFGAYAFLTYTTSALPVMSRPIERILTSYLPSLPLNPTPHLQRTPQSV
jgi:hypothetical protein